MDSLCNVPLGSQGQAFIVAPSEICQSCRNPSGPKFILSNLRRPSHIHRKNAIPTGADRDVAESNISYAQLEISHLDKEINRLQQSLETLKNRRYALQKFQLQEQGLFSPIRKLPAELLRQIFLQPYLHSNRISVCYNPCEFIRTATQVSSYWRSVAHSCAILWSKFNAHPNSNMSSAVIAMIGPFIEKCILLSNEVPLCISLGGDCTPEILGESCMSAMAQSVHRWKDVTIWNGRLLKALESHIPTHKSLTHLEQLDLASITDPVTLKSSPKLTHLGVWQLGLGDTTGHTISFQSAPSLVHITIQEVMNPFAFFSNLPWAQLTIFESDGSEFSLDELYYTLQSMPSLRSLSLKGLTETTRSVTLSHLESLKLHGFENTNALEILIAPRLKMLHLEGDFDPDSVVEFLQRSRCSLEEFRIHLMFIDDTWQIQELKDIKKLHWEDPQFFSDGVNWLTNGNVPGVEDLFPRLEILNVCGIGFGLDGNTDAVEGLKDMLKSRLSPVHPERSEAVPNFISNVHVLKSVHISYDKDFSADEISSLKDFIQSDVVRLSGVDMLISDNGETIVKSF
ncbi:hypothetical protein BDQ17DRAFT_483205 [Cyathus striatus]|nr:hypothetical protein BDQ17DRAFT_483205 [Cyathus striatus]